MTRKSKRMLWTMGAVIASVALVSGVVPLTDTAQANQTQENDGIVIERCSYEAGTHGDLVATIMNDQGLNGNGDDWIEDAHWIDDGGCIFVSKGLDADKAIYSATRSGGLSTDLGDLTLQFIAKDLSTGSEQPTKEVNKTLRRLPIDELIDEGGDPTNVTISVDLIDDVWGAGIVGGAVCTDADGDGMACGANEFHKTFCGSSGELKGTVDLTAVEALIVFTNGPVNQAAECDGAAAPAAAMGGIIDPAAGMFVTFDG